MPFAINLNPCASVEEGSDEISRYKSLGLPEEWSNSRISHGRWIAPDEYFWTPDGFFTAVEGMSSDLLKEIRNKTGGCFYSLPLKEQCKTIGIEYICKHPREMQHETGGNLSFSESVERFALDYYRYGGWSGESHEGSGIHILLYWARKILEKNEIRYNGSYYADIFHKDRSTKGMFRRYEISESDHKIIDEVLLNLTPDKVSEIYAIWVKFPHKFPAQRGLTPSSYKESHLLNVWNGLPDGLFKKFVEQSLLGYLGAGWPDLTLSKIKQSKFVEIKQTSDKLTHRQTYWIRNFARPLGLDASVLHITHSLKKQLKT